MPFAILESTLEFADGVDDRSVVRVVVLLHDLEGPPPDAYTIVPVPGIYDPIWDCDGKTLWKDASAHATYSVVTGSALVAINAVVRTGR